MAVPFFEDEEEIPVPEEDPVIEVIEVCGAWSEDDSDVSWINPRRYVNFRWKLTYCFVVQIVTKKPCRWANKSQ